MKKKEPKIIDLSRLINIHHELKDLLVEKKFEDVRQYIKNKEDCDNHTLRSILVAVKAFKDRPELKEQVEFIVNVLENRTGKKLY